MNIWHKHTVSHVWMKVIYIIFIMFVGCHLLYVITYSLDFRQLICTHFYKNILNHTNYTKQFKEVYAAMSKLYSRETCIRSGEIEPEITSFVKNTIVNCQDTSGPQVCNAVSNFALPFHRLCCKCTLPRPRAEYLFHLFSYICGATTVGYASTVEYFVVDQKQLFDFMYLMNAMTSFLGIILMAVMEGYMMFNLLERLNPYIWAEHNIKFLRRILATNMRASKQSLDQQSKKESELMSEQLNHTFLDTDGVCVTTNQAVVRELLKVFPSHKSMCSNEMLALITMSSTLKRIQMTSLMAYGYTVVVKPGFNIFFNGDLLRDIFIVVDGYIMYDSVQRGSKSHQGEK